MVQGLGRCWSRFWRDCTAGGGVGGGGAAALLRDGHGPGPLGGAKGDFAVYCDLDGAGPQGQRASEVRAAGPEPCLPPSPQSLEAAGGPSECGQRGHGPSGGHWRTRGPGRGGGSRWPPGVLPEARPGAWRASFWG